jgi:hypothetical protein
MKILLKEGASTATHQTILVLPQGLGTKFETLAGDEVDAGIVSEADSASLNAAINTGARERDDERIPPQHLLKEVTWMAKALGELEPGSPIGLISTRKGYKLDVSKAQRITYAEGLKEGDLIVVGSKAPQAYMNARGWVTSINGERVEVELEAADRDRIQRVLGKDVPTPLSIHIECLEEDQR